MVDDETWEEDELGDAEAETDETCRRVSGATAPTRLIGGRRLAQEQLKISSSRQFVPQFYSFNRRDFINVQSGIVVCLNSSDSRGSLALCNHASRVQDSRDNTHSAPQCHGPRHRLPPCSILDRSRYQRSK